MTVSLGKSSNIHSPQILPWLSRDPIDFTQQLLHQKSRVQLPRGPPCFARPEAGQHQSADCLWDDRHAAATLRGREVRRVLRRAAAHSETHRRGQRGGELGDAWRC